MPRYFRINTLKLTLLEDLRMAGYGRVLFLWIAKLVRRRLNGISGYPITVPFQDFVVRPECISLEAAEKLAAPLREAARLGFVPPVFQLDRALGGETLRTTAICLHLGGEMMACLGHIRVANMHPAQHHLSIGFMSQFTGGRLLVTTDQRPSFQDPPNVIRQRRIGGSFEELVALHRKKLDELALHSPPERVIDQASLAAFCDRAATETLEFRLRRGVFEEVEPEDAARQSTQAAANRALAGNNETDAVVLTEIEKLHNSKGHWKIGMTILLLSLVAFTSVGALQWDWSSALILTAVVAFHELGHCLAMRLLRFRDARMLFVHLLGGGVTGPHYNVKGWQLAAVSLAGPVPGIIVGWGLLALGLATHHLWLVKAALTAFVINGLTLLPVVGLDGGWVMHALLFSRHFIFEPVCRGLAGISLLGTTLPGLPFGTYSGVCLGTLALLGLPTSYRLALAAGNLRAAGLFVGSRDAQTVPPETALAILREIKELPQRVRSARKLAIQTLSAFQRLNASPPGAAASVLLMILYAGAGLGALLGIGAIFVAGVAGS